MKRSFILSLSLIILTLCLTSPQLQAQSFTFADTHPVNNPDSVERWLRANPKAPDLLRLKSLITLERTYVWTNRNLMGGHMPSVQKLAQQSRSATGEAAYSYLLSTQYKFKSQRDKATQFANKALSQFEQLTDASGMIHTHCLIASLYMNTYQESITSDSSFRHQHTAKALSLCQKEPTLHDRLTCYVQQYYLSYIERHYSEKLLQPINLALDQIARNPAGRYAYLPFLKLKANVAYVTANYTESYRLNRYLTAHYQPNQTDERIRAHYNLGNDCDTLGRFDEALTNFAQALALVQQQAPADSFLLNAICANTSRTFYKKGDFRRAYNYRVRSHDILVALEQRANDRQMLALQGQYEFDRRQQENALLKQKQQATQAQNRIILLALLSALAVIALITFLGLRLRQTNHTLNQVLAERDQTNQQLTASLQQVRQLNEARDFFMTIIAHDMRKPLIYFRGLADIINNLLKAGNFSQIRAISQSIDASGLDLENMLNNLFQWARKQQHKIPYQPAPVQALPIIQSVVNLFQQLVEHQQKTILIDCPSELTLFVDINALELIVRNLLDNALKNSPSGTTIRISCQDVPDDCVKIVVEDSGSGMTASQLGFLQDILSGKAEGYPGQNGLGMGLLLVREFTQANYGAITVESQPQKGTHFTIQLPKNQQASN